LIILRRLGFRYYTTLFPATLGAFRTRSLVVVSGFVAVVVGGFVAVVVGGVVGVLRRRVVGVVTDRVLAVD
jgi:tetrahydromethanopterin S-methyltransferase subunit C